MLQQFLPWLPRILILVQWMFGLAIAYVIANTGLILMGESGSESNSTTKASQVVNSTQSMPPASSLTSLISAICLVDPITPVPQAPPLPQLGCR